MLGRRLLFPLALVLFACTDVPVCKIETTPLQPIVRFCDATSSGLLLGDDGELVISRVGGDGTVTEVARLDPGSIRESCGTIAEDPDGGTIFVTVRNLDENDFMVVPHTLYRLSAAGELLGSETLEHEGAPVTVSSALFHAGSLWLAGTVRFETNLPNTSSAVLERRDAGGTLLWREISQLNIENLDSLVPLENDIVATLARNFGIDSAAVSLVIFDATGAVTDVELLTLDDFDGPTYHLSSAIDQLFVASQEQRQYAYDENYEQTDLLADARSIVTAYDASGTIMWTGELEWPELASLTNTEAAVISEFTFNVISGADDVADRHVALARHDGNGAVGCSASLDHLGLYNGYVLRTLDDERLLMIGSREVDPNANVRETVLTLIKPDLRRH